MSHYIKISDDGMLFFMVSHDMIPSYVISYSIASHNMA